MTSREAALVALGGAIGATARWATGAPFDIGRSDLPWTTLVVNVLGCLAIGVASRRLDQGHPAWGFTVTGLLGGFTTMSLFAVELVDLVDAGRREAALGYLAVTLTSGTVAVLLGEWGNRPDPAEGEP